MRLKIFLAFLTLQFFAFIIPSLGGEPELAKPKSFKNQFYIYWGYNRGWYTDSDITFQGKDYNFTLSHVVAKDRQSKLAADPYLHPDELTIPQTNFRVGYFFKDHWSVSIGDDHMKYVMVQDQTVKIDGYITNMPGDYNNVYNQEDIELTKEFLMFEHTDGLNYINIELRRMDNLLQFGKFSNANIDINLTEGLGTGILFPRTNTTLMGMEQHDEFHVSGYGFGGMVGINIMFWDHFFIQSELKAGYINMPDIRTTYSDADKASQHFFFTQANVLIGAKFRLFKSKAEKK